jgi:hypothetical protein
MEPVLEEKTKALEPSATPKPRRFRIVKLEERIAPSKGGNGTHNTCGSCLTCGTCADGCYPTKAGCSY